MRPREGPRPPALTALGHAPPAGLSGAAAARVLDASVELVGLRLTKSTLTRM